MSRDYFGSCFQKVEGWIGSFSIEVFSSIITPDWINEALEKEGCQTRRERKLSARVVVWLVIGMGFYRQLAIQNVLRRMGNVMGFGSLWEGGREPASTSVTEARDRVGANVLCRLAEKLREWILCTHDEAMRWKGLLLLAVDGTTFKMPDSEKNRSHFGLPGASRGESRAPFPQMRALFLVSTRLHMILTTAFASYHRAEVPMALDMLNSIPRGALVLLDRNFNAWFFLVGILRGGSQFLIRAKKNMKGKTLRVLGRGDRLLEMAIHRSCRKDHPELPKKIMVREIRVQIEGVPYRFFTSLLDPNLYPAEELVRLYHDRWEEEIIIDAVKTHQCGATTVNRPVIFRSKRPERVLQEAYGLTLAYNLVRALMVEGAERAQVSPIRISFIDSLERIRDAALLMAAAPTPALPRIYNDLIQSISRSILPKRKNRKNPRAVCIKMSGYQRKRKAS